MVETKPTFVQTPEQRAFSERQAKQDDARMRSHCNLVGFWEICGRPACRRNRSCSGEPHQCFERHWAIVPEDEKEWMRGAIMAKFKGAATTEELGRSAEQWRADYFKRMEKFSAPAQAEPANELLSANEPQPQPDVRIRRL
jgi:hypothetical protein